MNRKRNILISLTGITIVMLALLGLTYGYYITNIIGNTNSNSISIETKDLKLEYSDGTEDLIFGAIEPGWSNEDNPKVFTVNNIGKDNIDEYAVGIDEVVNELNRTEDLTYVIACKSYKATDYEADGDDATETGVCRGDSGEFPKENSLILTNQIDSGYIHVYKMVISYEYLDDVNQSEDMGASIGGRIQIYTLPDTIDIAGTVTNYSEGDYVEINSVTKTSRIVNGAYKLIGVEPGTHTLSIKYVDENDVVQTRSTKEIVIKVGNEAGISGDTITMNSTSRSVVINVDASSTTLNTDITGVSDRTKLLKDEIIANAIKNTNSNSTTGTIYGSSSNSAKVLENMEDDYGTSYYFKGNVVDNYLNYSGMCWRIVRIQGNGSIKITLADENHECDSDSYSESVSGLPGSSPALVDEGETTIMYTSNSVLLPADFVFENSNVPSTLSSWSTSHNLDFSNVLENEWCNDVANTSTVNEWDDPTDLGEYGYRYAPLDRFESNSPSLRCDTIGLGDLNGVGSKSILYKNVLGTLTSDEIMLAGENSYLVENADSSYWTMSPSHLAEGGGLTYMFISYGASLSAISVMGTGAYACAVRPTLVLKKDTVVSFKNITDSLGTQTNPYVIG